SSVSWPHYISSPTFDSMQVSTPVLTYMDNTLWIAESQLHLEQILHTAFSFYQMANIKVNSQKSILFLGCWFSTSLKPTTQSKLITQKATELINTLDTKQVTDKQAYITNNVIIPILEY
ncbi:18901_t:CDS:2, partial [Gigaspora rosea]